MRETEIGGRDPRFRTTQWNLVLAARDAQDDVWLRQALGRLVEVYWRPIYAYVRKEGYPVEQAKDLVQGFFASLIERRSLAKVAPDLGRFRHFLLACLRNYLSDQRDLERAEKRGGGRLAVSLDDDFERLLPAWTARTETPEEAFEKSWALSLVQSAFERLRREYQQSGRGPTYEAIEPFLDGTFPEEADYSEAARKIGTTAGNVRVLLHRARQRWRALLRDQVLQTLKDPADLEQELREVLAAR